jgi:putative acetyltransferase
MDETRPATLQRVERPEDFRRLRHLLLAYARLLEVDLTFQGFAQELEGLPAAYPPPGGAWLALRGDEAVGCVALRPLGGGRMELKRLFTLPGLRQGGIGRALVEAALAGAREAGAKAVRLDTLPGMDAAQGLYRKLGFRPIAPYRENPVPGAAFLELVLGRP